MFGSKQRAEKRRLIAAIQADGKRVRAHLAAQAMFAIDHLGVGALELWDDPYSRGYLFGTLDALLTEVPDAMRDTVAVDLIESGFVHFADNAFDIGEREARSGLADVIRRMGSATYRHAIADGRSDGLQMRQGMPATLWLAHIVDRDRGN